jgi:hypothetical protein
MKKDEFLAAMKRTAVNAGAGLAGGVAGSLGSLAAVVAEAQEVTPIEVEPAPQDDPTPTPEPQQEPAGDEIQVISYDRVTNDDGSQMDVAVIGVSGEAVAVVDVDLDGEADVILCDYNHNGTIESNEVVEVADQHIAMQQFQDACAAVVDPAADPAQDDGLIAQNTGDMPDYVNDADVQDYTA